MSNTYSLRFWILLIVLWSFKVAAQNLPDKQETGLYAPANVKIDGKIAKWGEPLMAFNKRVWIAYSIANDDSNLYLVIHSKNRIITGKIQQGGVTFTVNLTKKSEKGGVTVTYPLIRKQEVVMLSNENAAFFKKRVTNNEDKKDTQGHMDSTNSELGRRSLNKLGLIGITGVKAFPDSVISMYNTDGIKVGGIYGPKNVYDYELVIPLKYLGLSVNAPQKFNYNIKLLGSSQNNMIPPVTMNGSNFPPPLGEDGIDIRTQNGPTDFWGQYTLAQKPGN